MKTIKVEDIDLADMLEITGFLFLDIQRIRKQAAVNAKFDFVADQLERILKDNTVPAFTDKNRFKFRCKRGDVWFLWDVYGKRQDVICKPISKVLSEIHKYLV